MTVEELVKLAEEYELEPEDLDDSVHDAASVHASRINNEGLEAQIQYLVDAYHADEVEKIIRGDR